MRPIPNANRDDYSKSQGIQELKGFLGTADSDLSSTAPWANDVNGDVQNVFADENKNDTDFRDGNAKGYVIGYSLNSDNVLTHHLPSWAPPRLARPPSLATTPMPTSTSLVL